MFIELNLMQQVVDMKELAISATALDFNLFHKTVYMALHHHCE